VKPGIGTSKRNSLSKPVDDEAEDVFSEQVDSAIVDVDAVGTCKPVRLISEWLEPETRGRRLTLGLCLPSGVSAARGMVSCKVSDSGFHLELTVKWPVPMVNPKVMHRSKLENGAIEKNHPCLLGFQDVLKLLMYRYKDGVESTASIAPPFELEYRSK